MTKILKKPSDYIYYYPEQVKVGRKLVHGEIVTLAKSVGLSQTMVKYILKVGNRKDNHGLVEMAKKLIKTREKLMKINKN